MNKLGTIAFFVGLILAVVCAFSDNALLPWVVGGLGIVVGFLNVTETETKWFLIVTIGLVVALSAIHAQPYNPPFLTQIVLYVRVFVSHALLVVALLSFFKVARN